MNRILLNPVLLCCAVAIVFLSVWMPAHADNSADMQKSLGYASNMMLPDNATDETMDPFVAKLKPNFESGMKEEKNRNNIVSAIKVCTNYPVKDGKKLVLSFSGVRASDSKFNELNKPVNLNFYEQLCLLFKGDQNVILIKTQSDDITDYNEDDCKVIRVEGFYDLMQKNQNGSLTQFVGFTYYEKKDSQETLVLVPSELHIKLSFTYVDDDNKRKKGLATIVFDGKFDDETPAHSITVLDSTEIQVSEPEKNYDLNILSCDNTGVPKLNPDGSYELLPKFPFWINKFVKDDFVAFENGQKFKLLLTNKTNDPVVATVRIDGKYFYNFCTDEDILASLKKNGLYFTVNPNGTRVVEGWFISKAESKVFEIKPYTGENNVVTENDADSFSGNIVAEFYSAASVKPSVRGVPPRSIEVGIPDEDSVTKVTKYETSNWYNPTSKGAVSLRYCDIEQEKKIKSQSL